MWKRETSRSPVAQLHTPPSPPASIAKPKAAFDDVAAKWASLKGEVADLDDRITAARDVDRERLIELLKDGKELGDLSPAADKVVREQRIAQTKLDALAALVDRAGNELADGIEQAKPEWKVALQGFASRAAARFDAAVQEALAAGREIAAAQAGIVWLDEFTVGDAYAGRVRPCNAGRLRLDERRLVQSGINPNHLDRLDPIQLLELAAHATEAQVPRQAEASSEATATEGKPRGRTPVTSGYA